jgi:hypothetical protein
MNANYLQSAWIVWYVTQANIVIITMSGNGLLRCDLDNLNWNTFRVSTGVAGVLGRDHTGTPSQALNTGRSRGALNEETNTAITVSMDSIVCSTQPIL